VAKYETGKLQIDIFEFVDLARVLDSDVGALLRALLKAGRVDS
jgi:hypothetical protein